MIISIDVIQFEIPKDILKDNDSSVEDKEVSVNNHYLLCQHCRLFMLQGILLELAAARANCVTWEEMEVFRYHIFFGHKTDFFLPKHSQISKYVLSDRSKSLGLFMKGKTHLIAKNS